MKDVTQNKISQLKIDKGYKCFSHSDVDLSGILNNKQQ